MKIKLVAALIALTLSTPALAWDTAKMNAHIDQTNFMVGDGCSGTLVDKKDRLILTAHHCIDSQYTTVEKEVISDDGTVTKKKVRKTLEGSVSQIAFKDDRPVSETRYATALLAYDVDKDLALLQIKADIPNTTASKISCSPVKRGDPVTIVGNPMGMLYGTVHVGVASSILRSDRTLGLDGDRALLQVSGGVVGGNSGGSVYNDAGELVGVPVLAHRANEVLGFAVPLPVIRDFLKSNNYGRLVSCD